MLQVSWLRIFNKELFGSRFHHQALVEVKILDALRKQDKESIYNIIHMHEYFYFRNHLCITFELLGYVTRGRHCNTVHN